MIKKISVLGCGAWGTTQSILMNKNGCEIYLWAHSQELAESITNKRSNEIYLPGIQIPENIKISSSLEEVVSNSGLIVVAVASSFYRKVLKDIKQYLSGKEIILSTAKALEEETLKRMSQIVTEELGGKIEEGNVAVLSGPNLAFEISRGLPAATVVASINLKICEVIQNVYMSEKFRVYTNTDVAGVELGGTIKNIIALAAGTIDGLKHGNNTKAALLVRGLKEMTRFGCALGAKPETFFGLSGIGDLICTCSSNLSRNWHVGFEIAKGNKLEDILANMTAVAEGVNTSKVADELARKLNIDMPITAQICKVLFEKKSPYKAIADLMGRSPKAE